VASLVFAVLAYASHGSDRGNCQKHESGHFQPELVQNPPKRVHGRADPSQHRTAHPAALEQLDGRKDSQLDFSRCSADRQTVDHQSILAASEGTMALGGIGSMVMPPVSGVRFLGDSWISN
jgi:hypothetical protein